MSTEKWMRRVEGDCESRKDTIWWARKKGAICAIPVVKDLDAQILSKVVKDPGVLDMALWHCGTTHCRAGWAVTLAGKAGKCLEKLVGTADAAALIYAKSCPGEPIPNFRNGLDAESAAIRDMHDRVLRQVLAERKAEKRAAKKGKVSK